MKSRALRRDEFRCAQCCGVFTKSWTEEEARAEQRANGWESMDCAQVCDDCYRAFMGWFDEEATATPSGGEGGSDGRLHNVHASVRTKKL